MHINPKIKIVIKKFIPNLFLNLYGKIMLKIYGKTIAKKRLEEYSKLNLNEAFKKTYDLKIWGEQENLKRKFCSGNGSINPKIINKYIYTINDFLSNFKNPDVVDFGCGDFNVGSQIRHLCNNYYALDIVQELIDENKKIFAGKKVEFLCKDITKDNLPTGDIGFVRQVLQHLSNKSIHDFLLNIKNKYKYLVLTEHLPISKFKPNYDIASGPDNRTVFNSGVILHEPPFNLKYNKFTSLLKVPATPDSGIIETVVYNFD